MKRRVIASLLTLVLCLTLLPAPAFAEEIGGTTPEPAATNIYVSSTGNDVTGAGSEAKPYATLAKAVDVAGSGATIYVMSNLTMTKCARYYNKNLTITSYGETRTVTRGDGFETLSDTARSWYNPAMIEVQGNQEDATCGLTLTNIILDDEGNHEGTVFAQASSGKSEGDESNKIYVQDAMIASNATVPCTITLGEGAVLRNFGGMSAVRVTESAELVMKSGSKIEDTTVKDRIKGKAQGEVGAAGAVWIQGSSFTMNAGAVIQNIIGRAVYVDGGTATVGGAINDIKPDKDMWQQTNGIALHLRNQAVGTLNSTCSMDNQNTKVGGESIICSNACDLTVNNGAVIKNATQTKGIAVLGACKVDFDGEITGLVGNSNALNLQNGAFSVTLGKNANIHDNQTGYGTIYIQAQNGKLDIYGKINNNTASDRGGALAMANNFKFPTIVTMYDGAEICNNSSKQTGGGVMVSVGTFTMNGGTISGNIAEMEGGGVYVRRGGQFIMNGGTIENNATKTMGGGISFQADDYNNGIPCAILNAGTIAGNSMNASISTNEATGKKSAEGGISNDLTINSTNFGHINRNLFISDDMVIGNKGVYFNTNQKTVTPAENSLNIKLGNAGSQSIASLTAEAQAKGWNSPLATFWVQRKGAVELTVGGLSPADAVPVYVLTLPVDETGSVPAGAKAQVYAAQKTPEGDVSLKLPDVSGDGFAVAIVQPKQDFGTLTINGPETIKKNKTDEDYPVTYTVTYDMSESLKSIITQAVGNAEYSLVITKDTRLSGTPDSFDGNSIQVTYTLPNDAFFVGDSLFASAELTVTVGQRSYIIPSNVTETKLLGLESFHVVFDWNDGSGKTETVSVMEGEALGDKMPDNPTRSGYTFTGWNTQQDGKGSSFDSSTVITGSLTVYAQWSENSSGSGGDGSATYYYFAIEKVDAQDSHTLNGAKFGLYLDSKQIATATSNRSGIATFRVDESDYRKITTKSNLYYQELTAPEGYVVSSDKIDIEKSDLTTSQTTAEKNAETVRNYRSSTPDLLNDDDHFAYVIGYKDGYVRPYGLISRAETTTIFFRLLKDSVRDGNLLTSNTYTDVPDNYWANTAISTMTGLGIVQGRSSTTFDPKAPITRAQFAAICARFDTGTSSGTQTFSDISGHWAEKYIQRAAELGWIKGFEDGTFRPDTYITRAQAMTMINRVLNRIPEENSDLLSNMNVWPDCNTSDWFYLAVQEATNSHNYKHKAGNYETWTSMKQDPDWTRYEN